MTTEDGVAATKAGQRLHRRNSLTDCMTEAIEDGVAATKAVPRAVASASSAVVNYLSKSIPRCTNIVEGDGGYSLLLRGGDKLPLDEDEEFVFNPAEKLHTERGKRQLQLPESIYGAAIMVVLNRPTESTRRDLCGKFFPVYFALLITTCMQVIFAMFLRNSVTTAGEGSPMGDLAGTCDCTDAKLRMLALMAFTTFIANDVAESFTMHRWLWLFAATDRHEQLKMRNFRYSTESMRQERDLENAPSRRRRLCRPATGITKWERAAFYLFVLTPKLGIAGIVAWAGSGGVLRSGNNFDLVLNALAATFVIELDEWAYKMLIPLSLRNLCEHTGPINMHDDEAVPIYACGRQLPSFPNYLFELCEILYPVLMVGIVVAVAFLADFGWCHHVDVSTADACPAWEATLRAISRQAAGPTAGTVVPSP